MLLALCLMLAAPLLTCCIRLGSGEQRHDRQREVEDPRQGGDSADAAAPDLLGQAAGGRADAGRLQHPEGLSGLPEIALLAICS